MIKPLELESDTGRDIWDTITGAAAGDTPTLRRLLERDPSLSQAEYWYTQPIHFAVRAGHLDAVQLLLDSGADPEWNGYHDGSLIEMARDRGHEHIAQLLEEARRRRGRVAPAGDHPIYVAAEADDIDRVRKFLDEDSTLLERGDAAGGTPLHRAVLGSARRVIELLLDRGANIRAVHCVARGGSGGWWPLDLQAIDLAIWGSNTLAPPKRDFQTARLLLAHGAAYDLTIAAALGDVQRVTAILDEDSSRIREKRANGERPLSAAVEFGHEAVARLLLARGADPTWPERGGEKGTALQAAASAGNRDLVELLLAHVADPNSNVDCAGNALFAAKTPEVRALLIAHGGKVDPYELVFMDQDDEVMRRVTEDPSSAERGCGGVFTAVCTLGKRELLLRLLDAGIRVPPVLTACRGYLLENTEMFRILLDSGMNPDLPNWQRQTFLHELCRGGKRGQTGKQMGLAVILLDTGASINARESEYCSTPLGWAARTNMPDMVEFLLSRGALTNLPDDEPWATPLAWAERRGHAEVAEILREHGAQPRPDLAKEM
jgi:ankyrin repeat protein